MNDQPTFQAEVHQNRYLPAEGTVIDAVLTVTMSSPDGHTSSSGPNAAQVIMIDCSGSMANPPSKESYHHRHRYPSRRGCVRHHRRTPQRRNGVPARCRARRGDQRNPR